MNMDLDRIESLLKLMKEYGVAELGLDEDDSSLHLSMVGSAPTMVAAPAVAVPAVGAASAAAPVSGDASPAGNFDEVKSPMVGTFYSSAKPGAPTFVKVGDRVAEGQVLCIIEAMKLMNEIETETNGTVREICAENAGPVQFGQILFRIEPE
jgi:acetyl-CoA carboxylase biotin carboxyl carrier protein